MTIRIVFFSAATLVIFSGSSANAQGRRLPPPQQVVISEAVMKAMVANKTRSKTPPAARLGIVRSSGVASSKPAKAAPTSVAEVRPTSNGK